MSPNEIKDLMVATGGSATERAVAFLIAAGMTATKDIAEALGLTQRAVQMAKKRNQLRETDFAPEASFAKLASPPKEVSPKNETGFAHQGTETRARAYKESSSKINNPREGESALPLPEDRDVPRMNGKGFVISAKHDLYIPNATIAIWRERYPHIDLDEVLANLCAKILAAGCMHAGWQCPEGYLPKLLGEENRAAEAKSRQAELREKQIISQGRAPKPGPSRWGIAQHSGRAA